MKGRVFMMSPFMTLNDDTEITYLKRLIRNNTHLITSSKN